MWDIIFLPLKTRCPERFHLGVQESRRRRLGLTKIDWGEHFPEVAEIRGNKYFKLDMVLTIKVSILTISQN